MVAWRLPGAVERLARIPHEEHGGTRSGGDDPTDDVLDLSSNINPYGPLASVATAAREAKLEAYPDPSGTAAKSALADHWSVAVQALALNPGAAAGIHLSARAFVREGAPVVIAGPTFGEYRRAALAAGAAVSESAPNADGGVDLGAFIQAIADEQPSLAFLCSPNNPTGSVVTPAELDTALDALPSGGLLVLDESYRSFAEGRLAGPHRPGDPRIVHIRSFTKDLALPGLRISALCADPQIVDALERCAPPWAVSAPAQAALSAALNPESLEALSTQLARIADRRECFAKVLADVGWRPLPAQRASFVTSWAPNAEATASTLESQWGIRVRYCKSFGLPEHIRIGVPAETSVGHDGSDPIDRLAQALKLIQSE